MQQNGRTVKTVHTTDGQCISTASKDRMCKYVSGYDLGSTLERYLRKNISFKPSEKSLARNLG